MRTSRLVRCGFSSRSSFRPMRSSSAAILRANADSVVIPFDTRAYDVRMDPSDSILSLSERLAKYCGGGTDCSIPLRTANTKFGKRRFAGCMLVSDCESWVGAGRYGSTQAPERDDILNIGGFSDAVFNVVASYLSDDAARFAAEVESVEL